MTYRLPSRYRPPRRFRSRYRYGRGSNRDKAIGLAVGAVLVSGLAGGVKTAAHHHTAPHRAAPLATPGNRVAAQVIAFARQQIGKPYAWGGTGPDTYDCSGLAMMAYRSAGVGIERTSEQQWASERHVSSPRPGDLVFFAGSDGTVSQPGHVGIVTDPGRHLMIEAYATGFPVRVSRYGTSSSAPGDGNPVGFTDPAPVAATAARVQGTSEMAFIRAVLTDLRAPATRADITSMAAWYPREYARWPPRARNNPWDSTRSAPGSWPFNTLPGGGHVENYPTAAGGAQATALTLENGRYPLIVASLRSGAGLCGDSSLAGEFLTWSGNGYSGVC